jgi:AcrR family transcriptional regulator
VVLRTKGIRPESDTRLRLVSAARELLASDGYSELSLRAVAKLAGLSATAPYRHFSDGFPELIATLAIGGFDELIATLEKSTKAGEIRQRIIDLSLSYVRFGVEQPDLYRTMFSPHVAKQVELHEVMFNEGRISFHSRNTYRDLAALRLRAFDAIVVPLRQGVEAGVLRQGDPEEYGLALAALLHGLVGEFIDEGLGIRLSQKHPWSKARRDMSEGIIGVVLRGIERA